MDLAAEFDRLLTRKQMLEERIAASTKLSTRLDDLRTWQSRRLDQTYAGLRREPRYTPALEFFLSDLYGTADAARRDDELQRALGRLKRALPSRLIEILCMALELQTLTLELDQEMVGKLAAGLITAATYATAYRAVGRPIERKRQIDLIVRIGEDLACVVRQKWLGVALRAAHLPARAAGFEVLQSFLERGFSAFRRMGDPRELLAAIRGRETELMESLLRGDDSAISSITERIAVNG